MPTDLSHQANSFDEVAELYDRVRPRYPDALFDDMLARAGVGLESFVLELGCGTGIATLPVAERGHFLLGLEPGPNLVALLWRKLAAYPGATILETTFEAWDGRPGLFDLVYVAQAFRVLMAERDTLLRALAMVRDEVTHKKGGPEKKQSVSVVYLYDTVTAVFESYAHSALHTEQPRGKDGGE